MAVHIGAVMRAIVVLGYSDQNGSTLHPTCASRLERAIAIATDDDVVVLSGWARLPDTRSEAELMEEAWTGRGRELIIDPDATTTVGNAANALTSIRRVGATEVVVVTSRWHAPRARVTFLWEFRRTGIAVEAVTAPGGRSRDWLREFLGWLILPMQLLTRRSQST